MLNNALVLLKNIDYTEGTMFYAAVIPPTGQPVQGTGEVAVITFNFNQGAINPTTLQFLPKTKVTAKGIEDSVLQKATGITLAPPISFKNTGEMFAKN
jgi:hypothetical protein